MPQTSYPSYRASTISIFQIRVYRISMSNKGISVLIATISLKSQKENALRMSLVEYQFERWLLPQPFVHDCDILYCGSCFQLFFQQHKLLLKNPYLSFNGNLFVMQLGKKVTGNVINLQSGNGKLAHQIARHSRKIVDEKLAILLNCNFVVTGTESTSKGNWKNYLNNCFWDAYTQSLAWRPLMFTYLHMSTNPQLPIIPQMPVVDQHGSSVQLHKCNSPGPEGTSEPNVPTDSHWKPDKVHIIAGPNQHELDKMEYDNQCLNVSITFSIVPLKSFISLICVGQASRYAKALQNELESKEVDQASQEDLVLYFSQETQNCLCEMQTARDEALQEKAAQETEFQHLIRKAGKGKVKGKQAMTNADMDADNEHKNPASKANSTPPAHLTSSLNTSCPTSDFNCSPTSGSNPPSLASSNPSNIATIVKGTLTQFMAAQQAMQQAPLTPTSTPR
ncbi:hypothetical protein GYMLUDRAFT_63774 [Collybiopsis luxurians FD-317 M1]|uniref:Uncharacterized protein n=1 Tax=Collybiopsis luxurians FD-317 M1 TaxID=944289 RepID=A0A0D0CE34_9AGAR|nr:hypothetical protein GYMLUDRAFT_63774 [Collybiopsis luxurians FD-317 M1]